MAIMALVGNLSRYMSCVLRKPPMTLSLKIKNISAAMVHMTLNALVWISNGFRFPNKTCDNNSVKTTIRWNMKDKKSDVLIVLLYQPDFIIILCLVLSYGSLSNTVVCNNITITFNKHSR